MRCWTAALSFLAVTSLCAQTPEELQAVWQDVQQPDTVRFKALDDLVWALIYDEPDRAWSLASAQLALAQRMNRNTYVALAHGNMGSAAYFKGDMGASANAYALALKVNTGIGDKVQMAKNLNNLANTLAAEGLPDSALSCYQKSLYLREALHDDKGVSSCLNGIGTVYFDQGSYALALINYQRSLRIKERLRDTLGMINSLGNISNVLLLTGEYALAIANSRKEMALAEVAGQKTQMLAAMGGLSSGYFQLKHLDSAEHYGSLALVLAKELNNHGAVGGTLHSLGACAYERGDHTGAMALLNEALGERSLSRDSIGIARTKIQQGLVHRALKAHHAARMVCMDARDLAVRIRAQRERADACLCIARASAALGDMGTAYANQAEYSLINDSLLNAGQEKKVAVLQATYAFESKQFADSLSYAASVLELEREKTIQSLRADRNRNRILGLGGGSVLLIGGGLAFFISDRKRRQARHEKEAALLETQALRAQMNPHFIFNALNSINAYVQRNDQDKASGFLTKFAKVMRSVLENSRHAEVPLIDDLETLRAYMELERQRTEEKFDFTISVSPDIDAEEVMVPPLVVQPFVENAIWHGMAGKVDKGHIHLNVERRGTQLVYTIEDNGAGRKAPPPIAPQMAPIKKTSLGTAITRARLDLVKKQHGGHAAFHYIDLPQGTRVEVEMPLLLAS